MHPNGERGLQSTGMVTSRRSHTEDDQFGTGRPSSLVFQPKPTSAERTTSHSLADTMQNRYLNRLFFWTKNHREV
jgi:hypothetical protein